MLAQKFEQATLLSVDDKGDGRYLVKNEIKMEIEGQKNQHM